MSPQKHIGVLRFCGGPTAPSSMAPCALGSADVKPTLCSADFPASGFLHFRDHLPNTCLQSTAYFMVTRGADKAQTLPWPPCILPTCAFWLGRSKTHAGWRVAWPHVPHGLCWPARGNGCRDTQADFTQSVGMVELMQKSLISSVRPTGAVRRVFTSVPVLLLSFLGDTQRELEAATLVTTGSSGKLQRDWSNDRK